MRGVAGFAVGLTVAWAVGLAFGFAGLVAAGFEPGFAASFEAAGLALGRGGAGASLPDAAASGLAAGAVAGAGCAPDAVEAASVEGAGAAGATGSMAGADAAGTSVGGRDDSFGPNIAIAAATVPTTPSTSQRWRRGGLGANRSENGRMTSAGVGNGTTTTVGSRPWPRTVSMRAGRVARAGGAGRAGWTTMSSTPISCVEARFERSGSHVESACTPTSVVAISGTGTGALHELSIVEIGAELGTDTESSHERSSVDDCQRSPS